MMIASNIVIATIITVLLSMNMLREYYQLKTLQSASEAVHIVSAISKATIELSLERSLTQVALNLPEPISPALKQMLQTQRKKSDALFSDALRLLEESRAIPDERAFLTRLNNSINDIKMLRAEADRMVVNALSGRQPQLIERIPADIKKLVSSVDRLTGDIRGLMRAAPPDVIATDLVVQRSWVVREYGGRERTIFAILAAKRTPMTREDIAYASENHGRAAQAWELLDVARTNPRLSKEVQTAIAILGDRYFNTYQTLRSGMLAASESGDYPLDFQALFEQSEIALSSAVSLLDMAVNSNSANIKRHLDEEYFKIMIEIAIGLAVTLVIGFTIWFSLTRIVASISNMTSTMEDIVMGNIDLEVIGINRKDEIGAMARSVEIFRKNSAEIIRLSDAQRKNEEMNRVEKAKALEKLAGSFEESIREVAMKVSEFCRSIGNNANEVRQKISTAQTRAAGVEDAAMRASGNVNSVAAAAEELSKSIYEISGQVDTSAFVAERAVQQAAATKAAAEMLSKNASQIGAVVSLIRNIAEQTNLLALNATIEAARAGEAGRGFAVVASEVKTLAGQTATATGEIAAQVNDIQEATQGMLDQISSINATIEEISGISLNVKNAVIQQNAATSEIAQSIALASRETSQASSEIGDVSNSAKESLNCAEDLLQVSQSLHREAGELENRINTFLGEIRSGAMAA